MLYLIYKKLSKVLDVHLCLRCINYGNCTVYLYIQILCHIFNSLNNVRKLTYSRRLN